MHPLHLFFHYIHNLLHWTLGPIVTLHDYPIYAQNVGIALLTVLIPFIIAVFADILTKLSKKDEGLNELDRRVLLYHVFGLPYRFLAVLFMLFIPEFYWDSFNHAGRGIIIVLNIIGIAGMLQIYLALFNWAMGRKDPYRIKQLLRLKKGDDIVYSWRSVWKSANNQIFEADAFDAYDKTIRSLLQRGPEKFKDFGAVTFALIPDFSNHLKTGDQVELLIFRGKALKNILEWHQVSWAKAKALDKKVKVKAWGEYYGFTNQLDQLLNIIYEQLIAKNLTYNMFEDLIEHTKQFKTPLYLQELANDLHKPIFEMSDSDFWRDFPADWKITHESLTQKNNAIQATLFQQYVDFAISIISSNDSKVLEHFNLVTRELFPDLDPQDFPIILRLLIQPFGDSRMRSIIETEWYPTMSRVTGNIEELKSLIELQRKNMYEFADQHLGILNNYNHETNKTYLKELKQLKYDKGSIGEHKQQRLIRILEGINKYEKQRGKQSKTKGT